MAEALGAISSTITILDLAFKLRKCCKRIEAAPGVWKEYCDKLVSLSHVRSVLTDMISSKNDTFNQINSKELATLANKELRIIEKQAKHILGAYDLLTKPSRRRIWDWLRVKRATVKFVVAEEDLQRLIESAEKAKMSLQSALCLCGLESLNAGQIQTKDAFQLLHNSMKEQANALDRLNRDMKVRKIRFDLVDEQGRRVEATGPNETSAKAPASESKRSSQRSDEGKASARHGHSRKRESARARDNGEYYLQATGGYRLVLRNNQVSIVATDTDDYKPAADGDGTKTPSTRLHRVERTPQNASQDKWERGMGNHLYQSQLSFASNSVEDLNSLSASLNNETTPIIIDADKQSRAFVAETINMDQCVYKETDSMLFCVSYICITETTQTFTMKEPCQQPCRHIELQIMNKSLIAQKLPCMMELQSISCEASSGETDDIQPSSNFILECYGTCPHRNSCSHTLLEGDVPAQDARNRQMIVCVCSDSLKAWLGDSEQESNTPAESPGQSDTPTVTPGSTSDDDEIALALLEKVERGDDTVPARIPFEALVGYLKLIERLQLSILHVLQCQIWADAIASEVSSSFDKNIIAWAWVLWKLERGAEFKKLTAIIQRQGKHPVDHETNQYGVNLPYHIIDAINHKRISALSQIRDLVQNHIETCRVNYLTARTEDDPDWGTPLDILRSSLTAGYLTLEYEIFLLNGQTEDNGSFNGVSFNDALDWVRSMMNLGDWEVRTVPPAHRMPFVLSGLAAMVPVLGVGLHEAGICSGLSSNVYEDLNGLMRRLGEEEDWGVDLLNE